MQATGFDLHFFVKTEVLSEMEHDLRVDENVMRWVIRKRPALPKLPDMSALYKEAPELQG